MGRDQVGGSSAALVHDKVIVNDGWDVVLRVQLESKAMELNKMSISTKSTKFIQASLMVLIKPGKTVDISVTSRRPRFLVHWLLSMCQAGTS